MNDDFDANELPAFDFADEASERQTERTLDVEAALHDPATRLLVETAYRRGFQQGAFVVLKNVADCGYSDELEHFVLIVLHHWRFGQHNGEFCPPPASPAQLENANHV